MWAFVASAVVRRYCHFQNLGFLHSALHHAYRRSKSSWQAMDQFDSPLNAVTFASWLLALIVDANQTLHLSILPGSEQGCEDVVSAMVDAADTPVLDTMSLLASTLHNYRLCVTSQAFPADVEFWVKPRYTTWFSRFLVDQYDNSRWISMFRMTKTAVFSLADLLKPHVAKKNTRYRLAVPVLVRVACTLFKLTHGANLTICSEMFAIGRSTVCKVLREVVHAINDTFKNEISWPSGERMRTTQAKFASLCSLPAVVGAIDGTHVSIAKPDRGAADYFYFKTGGYSVNCQAVVDSEKRFLDLYVGMPGSTNDSRMLRRSSLHFLASRGDLMDSTYSVDGHSPYLLGDLGYPLLPWLMVPHRGGPELSISDSLFNKKLRRGRCVVENAFGILKQSFRELLGKSDLQLTFLPDVIVCCAILHNILLSQSHEDVENFLRILRSEGLEGENDGDDDCGPNRAPAISNDGPTEVASEKRSALGVYLSTRRRPVDAAL